MLLTRFAFWVSTKPSFTPGSGVPTALRHVMSEVGTDVRIALIGAGGKMGCRLADSFVKQRR